MNDDTNHTNIDIEALHREVFPTETAAENFETLSIQTNTIPTVLAREKEVCYVQTVNTDFDSQSDATQRKFFCEYITALQYGVKHNIYHLDIKPSHFGHTKETGVLLDWGDAYCPNESSVFFFTIKPNNITNVFENPTAQTLKNAIISQVGQLAYDLEFLDTNQIHTSPELYSLSQIKERLSIQSES